MMFFLGLVWAEDELIQDSDPVDSFGTDEVAGFELEPDDFEDPLGDYVPPFADLETEDFKDKLMNPYPWPFEPGKKEELDISKEEPGGLTEEPPWEGEIPLPSDETEGEDDCYAYQALYKASAKIVIYGDKSLVGQYYKDREAEGWVQEVSWAGYSGQALPHWVKFPPVFAITEAVGGGKQYSVLTGGRTYPFANAAETVTRDVVANRVVVVKLIRIDSITVLTSCGTFEFPSMDATQEEAEQPAKEEDMNPCCQEEQKIKANKKKPKKKTFSGDSGVITVPSGHAILEVVYKIQPPQQSTKAFSGGVLGEIHLSGSFSFDLGERLPFSFLEGKLHPPNERTKAWAFLMKTGYTCEGTLLYYSTKV